MKNERSPNYGPPSGVRDLREEARRRYSAAPPAPQAPPSRAIKPSAEVWVIVVFALAADFVSRAFAWLRILVYSTLIGAIYYLSPGAVPISGLRHGLIDLIAAAVLLRSIWLLLKRECFK